MTRWGRSTCILALGLLATAPLYAQRRLAQGMSHVPAAQLALACSPTLVFEAPSPSLVVTGGQDSYIHHAYGAGELLTINGGAENGIEVGQEYFVRRLQPGRLGVSRANPAPVSTVGWVKVYAIDKTMSLVSVTHVCDTIEVGDFLEPFVLPTMPVADPRSSEAAAQENYGHIVLGTRTAGRPSRTRERLLRHRSRQRATASSSASASRSTATKRKVENTFPLRLGGHSH